MWKNARKFLHENFRRAPKKEGFALLDRRNAPVFSGCTFGKFCPFFANFANFFYIFLIFTKMHIFTFFTKKTMHRCCTAFWQVAKNFSKFCKNFFRGKLFSGNFFRKFFGKKWSKRAFTAPTQHFWPFFLHFGQKSGGPPPGQIGQNWPKLSKMTKNGQKLSKMSKIDRNW